MLIGKHWFSIYSQLLHYLFKYQEKYKRSVEIKVGKWSLSLQNEKLNTGNGFKISLHLQIFDFLLKLTISTNSKVTGQLLSFLFFSARHMDVCPSELYILSSLWIFWMNVMKESWKLLGIFWNPFIWIKSHRVAMCCRPGTKGQWKEGKFLSWQHEKGDECSLLSCPGPEHKSCLGGKTWLRTSYLLLRKLEANWRDRYINISP